MRTTRGEFHGDIGHRIAEQIGALAEAVPHRSLAGIVEGVDEIRRLARDHGFAALESLASRLESAVGHGGYRATILLTYLDAMHDAARAPRGPMSAAAHEAWLASVAVRLGH